MPSAPATRHCELQAFILSNRRFAGGQEAVLVLSVNPTLKVAFIVSQANGLRLTYGAMAFKAGLTTGKLSPAMMVKLLSKFGNHDPSQAWLARAPRYRHNQM